MSNADSEESSALGLDAQSEDMALLRRYVDLGSHDAFNQLVSRHLSWVHATCRKGLRDRHMAEDAAQAVFIILARRAASITPQTRLSGWLFNTARFVIKDAKKQETRYRRRENVAREMSAVRLTPVREPVDAHTQAHLDDALATLTERDRLALLMHFYEGLSLQEMADSLGITKDGAKKRVARALSRLRTRMARNGKSAAATVAILIVLLRSRAAEAAPLGLAQTVSSSATVPGVATSVARWMAQRAMSTSAGASRRLLRALVVFELVTAATLVTVGSLPARRPVAVTSVAQASVAQVQPAASAAPARPTPPAPAKAVTVAAAEPVTPYRSGAFDPEPRVEPLPPFKDEPKPMAQTAPAGGGSGLVASSTGGAGVSTFTMPAYGTARTSSAVQQQLPAPPPIARAVTPPLPSIAPASGGGTASRAAAPASETSASASLSKTAKTPVAPAAEPPIAGGKGHTSWLALPPLAMAPPPVNESWPHPPAVARPPRLDEKQPTPEKDRPAKSEEYGTDYPDRGGKIVMFATADDRRDHDFGFGTEYGHGRGPGHIRREFIEETFTHSARGHKHAAAAVAAASNYERAEMAAADAEVVPRYEPAVQAADLVASTADCPPVTADKSLDLTAIAATSTERDTFATAFARPFAQERVMTFEAPAAVAADYAFAGSPALFAQAVPEPSSLVAAAFAGLCGLHSRRRRRR